MEKLIGKYEKKERELFDAEYPCIYLMGTHIEDGIVKDSIEDEQLYSERQ